MEDAERYFTTRHAKPARDKSEKDPVSIDYPDLTQHGVEQARERARQEISNLIDRSSGHSVIFIGATSDQPRTKQTAEIYGDELSSLGVDRNDLVVVTRRQIESIVGNSRGISEAVRSVQELLNSNSDKKVVIDFPLMVKQLAYKFDDRWTDSSGNKTPYFSEVLKKHNNDHAQAGLDWIANDGKLELNDGRVLQGPRPEKVAREYLEGLRRLRKFVNRYVGGRPVVIGEVGHQWDIDALVTYLATNGHVDKQSFDRVTGGQIAGETEFTEFTIDGTGTHIRYRGKEFDV